MHAIDLINCGFYFLVSQDYPEIDADDLRLNYFNVMAHESEAAQWLKEIAAYNVTLSYSVDDKGNFSPCLR